MSISDITFDCNLHAVRLNNEYESIYEPIKEDGRIIGYSHILKKSKPKYSKEEMREIVIKHYAENIIIRLKGNNFKEGD
jgi:hypothetical protein